MKENLLEFKKNIISWYPIEKKDTILQVGKDEEITKILKEKSNNVSLIENIDDDFEIKAKFDYVTLIGSFENLSSEKEIISLLKFAENCLTRDGKILLAMQNKYGMKYWAGDRNSQDSKDYENIIENKENILSYSKIKNILNNLKLKYKFYYPLPDYKLTNVIYTDEFMPTNDSIDSRILTFCEDGEILNFSEREAYKELINQDKNLFPFFSNSFFIEISTKDKFEDIRFVSFGITRKQEYRIKTVIGKNFVYKYADTEKSKNHIEKVSNNIKILNDCKILSLGKVKENYIESEFLRDAISYDEFLMQIYYEKGLNEAIEKIKEFKENVLEKLLIYKKDGNTVFQKYDVQIPKVLEESLHFTKNGLLDLIFQNCLVKKDKVYAYDQEWYEENVPLEFILYRAILYFTELKKIEDLEKILKLLDLEKYEEYFKNLEDKLQEKILDKDMWDLHVNSVKCILPARAIKTDLDAANEHIENLENNIKEYQKGIEDLTKLVKEKDVELVNYANQLRAISSSLSWKITKPVRILAWMLNPNSGASFIDRIMPPGGKRRAEYDKKQTEKKYKKKVENYFKLTDEKTAEYWKGIDHRKYLKYEKDLEREKDNELSDYEKWIKANNYTDAEIEKQEKTKFKKKPKISIVIPLYNTDTEFFRELLYSVHSQTYKNWELCLADGSEQELEEIKKMVEKDKRIKYKFLGENKGISENTNEAIKMATGDYISLLDHDDMLEITALYEIVKVINENKDVDFIYSDEDKFHFIDEPDYAPHFKPDYAPDTLRANNYICHYSVFKKELLEKIGGFNSEYNGAQDYDIILRMSENAKKIIHISKVLYHWRVHKSSTSMTQEAKPYAILAGQKAIEAHLKRVGLNGTVSEGANAGTYKIDYEIRGNPKISILIPNKDGIDLLEACINSIINKSTYNNYEIVIIENNSEKTATFDYYKELIKNEKIKVLNFNKNTILDKTGEKELVGEPNKGIGFNYSKIINFGVKNVNGDYIVQLNNDTEILTKDWLEKMLGFAQREDVGAVGVKLYYSDETIQHAGIIVGARTVAAHLFRGLAKDEQGYFGRENIIQNMNAVTAACIMTKKSIYEEVGYMNEDFAVAFNDIDFCLKIRNTGRLIVYNPFVELMHYESKTRGDDNAPEKIERFKHEINLFLEIWKDKLLKAYEYYNINFNLESDKYDIRTDKV